MARLYHSLAAHPMRLPQDVLLREEVMREPFPKCIECELQTTNLPYPPEGSNSLPLVFQKVPMACPWFSRRFQWLVTSLPEGSNDLPLVF